MEGFLLNSPHASLIVDGRKTAIISEKLFSDKIGQPLIFFESSEEGFGDAYGTLIINEPEEIDLEQFQDRRNQHRITDEERKRNWPGAKRLLFYRFKVVGTFSRPRKVKVSTIKRVQLSEDEVGKIDSGDLGKFLGVGTIPLNNKEEDGLSLTGISPSTIIPAENKWKLRTPPKEVMKESYTSFQPIIKIDEDEQIVYGIVLEPNIEDAQGDILTKAEIRKAAHNFMQQFQTVGVMHKDFSKQKQLRPVESFLVPVDMVIKNPITNQEFAVNEGTWIMATKILDKGIWKDVKSGLLTGYSIGGFGQRQEELAGA